MKDNFSAYAGDYARYRPHYPRDIYDYIFSFVKTKKVAWDCGTGNGQAANELAKVFKKVIATDISPQQISQAPENKNVSYVICPAHHTTIEEKSIQLITIAQALHWFDLALFYREVERVADSNAVIAAWGYGLCYSGNSQVDTWLMHLYNDILGKYWDVERKYIDEAYSTIHFPFTGIPEISFSMKKIWSLLDFKNYLATWSALKRYSRLKNTDPLADMEVLLKDCWPGNGIIEIDFPIFLRAGYVHRRI